MRIFAYFEVYRVLTRLLATVGQRQPFQILVLSFSYKPKNFQWGLILYREIKDINALYYEYFIKLTNVSTKFHNYFVKIPK